MNGRLLAAALPVLWAGATLVLAEFRLVNRRTLAERIGPYAGNPAQAPATGGPFSVESLRAAIAPAARLAGANLARVVGISEDLAVRLERCHSPLDVSAFRLRQLGWATAAFGVGAVVPVALGLPAALDVLFVLGAPLLAFLAVEQQLASESARWQRRLWLELPIVAEQLGMLLSAGYSLSAALSRLAARGNGATSRDLARVCARVQQGLSDVDALREWAQVAGVEGVERLVAVLALNREAGDLGRLISEEARAIRREVQRGVIETIERRGQQVWIPVTVATLVPGVIFLAVPFIEAMRLFAGS